MFIWGNSLLPAEQSTAISDKVARLIRRLLPFLQEAELSGLSLPPLRKIGHFAEYALLGAVALFIVRRLGPLHEHWTQLALTGLGVSFIDESIQLFSPGRGPAITDMWIDLAGFTLGALIGWTIWFLIARRQNCEIKRLS